MEQINSSTLPQSSFSQLHKLLDSLTEVICIIDLEGRFVYLNNASHAIWGYHPEELVGTLCFDLILEEDKAPSIKAWEKLLAGSPGFEFENHYYHKDGHLVTMVWIGRWDREDQLLYVSGRDITEKKRTQQELYKLSYIIKKAKNPVLITDAEGKIAWANDAFVEVNGYTLEEALGKLPEELFEGPETDTKTSAYLKEQLQKGAPAHVEIIIYRKNKRKAWVEIYFQPIYNNKGEVEHFFYIEIDITEKKKIQEQLDKEKTEKQKSITSAVIKAQEQERAQVSLELHDNVNQVLTTVKLYTELCLQGLGNGEELMKKSVQLLQESIDEIRSLSKRLSSPSIGMILLEDSIKELIDAVKATNQLAITLDIKEICKLEVSQEVHLAVYRILQEHLTNILKHACALNVTVQITKSNKKLFIRVEDDGIGFNPKKKRKGIGISNMISRAEALKGTLKLISAEGKGCILEATIPFS